MPSIRPTRQVRARNTPGLKILAWLLKIASFPIRVAYAGLDAIFDLKRRGADSNLRRLKREVENQYDFLFTEHGGRIVPELSSGYPAMDFATVVIQLSTLYLRAVRDRGYTEWYVSLNGAEHSWKYLDPILRKISPPHSSPYSENQGLLFHLPEIEQVLRLETEPKAQ